MTYGNARAIVFVIAVVVIVLLLGWVGLVGLHVERGTTLTDAVKMTVEDLRVATSCPGNGTEVWDFITRPDTQMLSKRRPNGLTDSLIEDICGGSIRFLYAMPSTSAATTIFFRQLPDPIGATRKPAGDTPTRQPRSAGA